MDETVPLRYDGFTNQTTVSACNDKQEETEDANDSFPTPPEDESQQYLEQKVSSFALVPHEELTSEMSVETPLEDKEAESSLLKEEEELEALMEVLCRAENKLMDVTHRVERFRTPKGRKKLSKSSSCLSEEDYVVYVPTAEIKVKR
ncbi:hypothetical protein F2Q68_00029222 [Brassica cretica]|nr:hypothetical protein F2Q68_00029222 [Brassica cretica]